MTFWPAKALLLGLLLFGTTAWAEVCAVDDAGHQVCLEQPAQRIASLSPGGTELLWAAGAGDQVVAVVEYSDYPPQARAVPSVGNHTRIDLEALLSLRPELVVAWVSGNPAGQIEKLQALGLPVFAIEPREFAGVSTAIERLGLLAGTESVAVPEASAFRDGIGQLQQQYANADPVTVFYQVWNKPLMTINDDHLIAKVIRLCGGRNIFGDQSRLAPRIDVEAVLAANPEAILTSGEDDEPSRWFDGWRRMPDMLAVQRDNLFQIPPSLISRPTPRLLEGSRLFCQALEQARGRR